MWENIFPVRTYFYLSSNDWRMCAQTAPVSWLLVKKTICDVSRKMSRNCFSQVFLIWAKKFTNMKSTNWTLLWSEVLIKSDRIWTFPTNWCFFTKLVFKRINSVQRLFIQSSSDQKWIQTNSMKTPILGKILKLKRSFHQQIRSSYFCADWSYFLSLYIINFILIVTFKDVL